MNAHDFGFGKMTMRQIVLVCLVVTSSSAYAKNALEHLRAEPRPVFKEGHTLLPLSP